MPLQLTDEQKSFLAKADRVAQLASWVIASTTNRYARDLCTKLRVPQSNRPSSRQVTTVGDHLRSREADPGVVARLINHYRHTHAQQP